MQDDDGTKGGKRRIVALALSLGAVAAPVSAVPAEAVQERSESSEPVEDQLHELRGQFEIAFTPGAVDLDDDASANAPSMISE